MWLSPRKLLVTTSNLEAIWKEHKFKLRHKKLLYGSKQILYPIKSCEWKNSTMIVSSKHLQTTLCSHFNFFRKVKTFHLNQNKSSKYAKQGEFPSRVGTKKLNVVSFFPISNRLSHFLSQVPQNTKVKPRTINLTKSNTLQWNTLKVSERFLEIFKLLTSNLYSGNPRVECLNMCKISRPEFRWMFYEFRSRFVVRLKISFQFRSIEFDWKQNMTSYIHQVRSNLLTYFRVQWVPLG